MTDKEGFLQMQPSGRWASRGPAALRFAEYLRRPDAVKPNASCIGTISNGKISAQIHYTETSTCRRPWVLCPRCSRRCRVLFLGFGRVCVPALLSAAVPVAMPRPDLPRSTQWSRLPNKSIQRRRRSWISRTGRRDALDQVQPPHRAA